MREWLLRPGALAAGGAIMGGTLMVLLPQHGMSILRAMLVAFAAVAGLFALAVVVPRGSVTRLRVSPFDASATEAGRWTRSREVDRIRGRFGKPRTRIPGGPALPGEILQALRNLLRQELEALGLNPEDPDELDAAGGLISEDAWAILTAPSLPPHMWTLRMWPNSGQVARVVQSILDEVDQLHSRGADLRRPRSTPAS